jgi:very-short-patch-repair endonuclease
MELDLYNAELKLAVEYDGPHHYSFPNEYHATLEEFQQQHARDVLKDARCAERAVKLIRVKCGQGPAVEVQEVLPEIRAWLSAAGCVRTCQDVR